jgi:DNA-binding response OmpR family regulator
LVVEDEQGIVTFLRRGFEAAGYTMLDASDGRTGLELAFRDDVELVVLDLGLPGMRGEEVLRRLRERRSGVPVIMLTAMDAVADRVANLDAGANDYLVKPFSFSELLARVRVQLRTPDQPLAATLRAGELQLDLRTRHAIIDQRRIDLSAREFALCEVLVRHAGQVMSQAQLLDQVWGYAFDGGSNVVEVYVRHLRRKLGAHWIETVRGAGYRLVAHGAP